MWIFVRPVLALWPLTPIAMRAFPLVDLLFWLVPRPRRVLVDKIVTDEFRGEFVRAGRAVGATRAILYMHGGAFLFCGLATHPPNRRAALPPDRCRRVVGRLSAGPRRGPARVDR